MLATYLAMLLCQSLRFLSRSLHPPEPMILQQKNLLSIVFQEQLKKKIQTSIALFLSSQLKEK